MTNETIIKSDKTSYVAGEKITLFIKTVPNSLISFFSDNEFLFSISKPQAEYTLTFFALPRMVDRKLSFINFTTNEQGILPFKVYPDGGGGQEIIEIDKKIVKHGDIINWTAKRLVKYETYRVGIWVEKENKVYEPIEFVPDVETKSGTYKVPDNVPLGDHWFVLQRKFQSGWLTADMKPITVSTDVKPKLSLNKTVFVQNEVAQWTANNLKICFNYKVGTMKNGNPVMFYAVNQFHADISSKSGFHLIIEQPGNYDFVLVEENIVVDKIPIEVKSPEGGGGDLITWLMKNWWIIAIILFILFLVFRR